MNMPKLEANRLDDRNRTLTLMVLSALTTLILLLIGG